MFSQKVNARTALFLALLMSSTVFFNGVFAISEAIPVQGKLTDTQGNALTGTYPMLFELYDNNSTGSLLWAETRSITTANGVFNTTLGDINTDSYLNNVDFNTQTWLSILVDGTRQQPMIKLGSGPSAFSSKHTYGGDSNFASVGISNNAYLTGKIFAINGLESTYWYDNSGSNWIEWSGGNLTTTGNITASIFYGDIYTDYIASNSGAHTLDTSGSPWVFSGNIQISQDLNVDGELEIDDVIFAEKGIKATADSNFSNIGASGGGYFGVVTADSMDIANASFQVNPWGGNLVVSNADLLASGNVTLGPGQLVNLTASNDDEVAITGGPGGNNADIGLRFDSGNDGLIKWMEDERRFDIANTVNLTGDANLSTAGVSGKAFFSNEAFFENSLHMGSGAAVFSDSSGLSTDGSGNLTLEGSTITMDSGNIYTDGSGSLDADYVGTVYDMFCGGYLSVGSYSSSYPFTVTNEDIADWTAYINGNSVGSGMYVTDGGDWVKVVDTANGYSLHANSDVRFDGNVSMNSFSGYSGDISVRKGDDSGACLLKYVNGILVGTTC